MTQKETGSTVQVFGFSAVLTAVALGAVLILLGPGAAAVTLVLIAIEIAFSFDNAIVNAKILATLSPFWRRMFLTLGMVIAVLGMRIIFPIAIVAITAQLPWHQVLHLALDQPDQYAAKLDAAHTAIASFGGAFLLMLALDFFLDDQRRVLWLTRLERFFQRFSRAWLPALTSLVAIGIVAIIPANHEPAKTLGAGALGVVTYIIVQLVTRLFGATQQSAGARMGFAALSTFVYLEILDASFSFDGVLGAFAVTSKVVLIATGLGVGAFWVRSLTVFMVRRGTLQRYRYIEHGAHYTILMLALLLLASVVVTLPDVIAGLAGLGCIGASFVASRQALEQQAKSR